MLWNIHKASFLNSLKSLSAISARPKDFPMQNFTQLELYLSLSRSTENKDCFKKMAAKENPTVNFISTMTRGVNSVFMFMWRNHNANLWG